MSQEEAFHLTLLDLQKVRFEQLEQLAIEINSAPEEIDFYKKEVKKCNIMIKNFISKRR